MTATSETGESHACDPRANECSDQGSAERNRGPGRRTRRRPGAGGSRRRRPRRPATRPTRPTPTAPTAPAGEAVAHVGRHLQARQGEVRVKGPRPRARDPSGASRCPTSPASAPNSSARERRRARRPRALRAFGNAPSPPSCTTPARTDSPASARDDRVDVGVVAEELQRDVPLLARACGAALGERPANARRATASSTSSGGRTATNARVTRASAVAEADLVAFGIAHHDPVHAELADRLDARRARTRRTASASASMSADDQVEVHAVLPDLRLGHLLEHELRPAVARDDRRGTAPPAASRRVAQRLAVEVGRARRRRRSRC